MCSVCEGVSTCLACMCVCNELSYNKGLPGIYSTICGCWAMPIAGCKGSV